MFSPKRHLTAQRCPSRQFHVQLRPCIWRTEVWKSLYTDISADSNGNFDRKTRGISDCRVCSFWSTVPVNPGSYSMPKPREFVHNKSETTLFRIASHFWTNIEYSHRVQTSIFVEIILCELTPVSKHRDFMICPSSEISSTTKPKL